MKNRIFIGEFIGSCFLVMIIVGSGILAENLTDDDEEKYHLNNENTFFEFQKKIDQIKEKTNN